jgi:hypothetical protein
MLTRSQVEVVRELLAAGHSHRSAGTISGVCRSTVNAIARGKCDGRREDCPESGIRSHRTGQYVRCGGCGGKVIMPCVLCNSLGNKEYP